MTQVKDFDCKCPESIPDCKCPDSPMQIQLNYALNQSIIMILNGVVGGLAVGIAIILAEPIGLLIALTGLTDPLWVSLITIAIYLIFAVIIILLMIPINKRLTQAKEIANYNNVSI